MASRSTDTQAPDRASAPPNFENKSPFRKKAKKKEPLGNAAMTLGFVALAVSLLVVGLSMIMTTAGG